MEIAFDDLSIILPSPVWGSLIMWDAEIANGRALLEGTLTFADDRCRRGDGTTEDEASMLMLEGTNGR
jgi:hypothetical protein